MRQAPDVSALPAGTWLRLESGRATLVGKTHMPVGARTMRVLDGRRIWRIQPGTPCTIMDPTTVDAALQTAVDAQISSMAQAWSSTEAARQRLAVGDAVRFTSRGASLRGTIVRFGSRNITVDVAGTYWTVAPTELVAEPDRQPANALDAATSLQRVALDHTRTDCPFYMRGVQGHLLEALAHIHRSLNPENLSCDGERPRVQVITRRAALLSQATAIEAIVGFTVDEDDLDRFLRARHAADDRRHGIRATTAATP